MDWKEINERWVKPARSAWMRGHTEEAERIFRDGLEATNNDGFVALVFAQMLEELGRLPEARQHFDVALSKLPLKKYKDDARHGLDRVKAALREKEPGEREWPPPGKSREAPRRRWGLISCTKRKKPYVCTARELYSESNDFVRHLQFAEEHYDRVFVVSARHGLVALDQIVSPYDRSLSDFNEDERISWAAFIAANLRLEGVSVTDDVYIHADKLYADHLTGALSGHSRMIRVIDFDGQPTIEDLFPDDGD